MTSQISAETVAVLRQYVKGELSNADLEDWLTKVEYDNDSTIAERDALALIRQALTEFSEGSIDPSEVLCSVTAVLTQADPKEQVVALRSGSSTSWQIRSAITATSSPRQRVGI